MSTRDARVEGDRDSRAPRPASAATVEHAPAPRRPNRSVRGQKPAKPSDRPPIPTRPPAVDKELQRRIKLESEHRRKFLRGVEGGASDGRLVQCGSVNELPRPLLPLDEPISLSFGGSLSDLRHRTRLAAEIVGLSRDRVHDLVTAVGEAAMNAVVHAGEGVGEVTYDEASGIVQVSVTDFGSGIAEEHLTRAASRRGYEEVEPYGQGMKMMMAVADRVFLMTGPTGTIVVIEQHRDDSKPSPLIGPTRSA